MKETKIIFDDSLWVIKDNQTTSLKNDSIQGQIYTISLETGAFFAFLLFIYTKIVFWLTSSFENDTIFVDADTCNTDFLLNTKTFTCKL